MVDGLVVKRPHDGNRLPYTWILEVSCGSLFNWRSDVPLRRKVEDRWLGRVGRVLWKVGTFKLVVHICVS
jgi:hypothetical protein